MISVDKASVFATSRLWRRIARATAAASGIAIADVNVDRAAYELVARADLPSVIVTEGIFGDILSDVVCARAGSARAVRLGDYRHRPQVRAPGPRRC